jgi:predicted lysophospholipase L1 biosynthesis ABC-type transport system permease subunit
MRRVSEHILAWVLWAVTSAIGFFVAYMTHTAVVTTTRFVATTAAGNDPHLIFQAKFTGDTVYQFGLIIMAIPLLILLVATEPYYRAGVEKGELPRRFVLLTTIELGILFVALALQVIVTGILGLFTISGLLIALGVLALTVLGSWAVTRLPKGSDVPPMRQ